MNRKKYTAFKKELKTFFCLACYTLVLLLIFGAGQYIANQPSLTKIELLLAPAPLLEK